MTNFYPSPNFRISQQYFSFLLLILERQRGEPNRLQHDQLPLVQESVEVLRGASHVLQTAFAPSAQSQHLLDGNQVQIQVRAGLWFHCDRWSRLICKIMGGGGGLVGCRGYHRKGGRSRFLFQQIQLLPMIAILNVFIRQPKASVVSVAWTKCHEDIVQFSSG